MAISKEQIASSDSTLYTNVACDQIKGKFSIEVQKSEGVSGLIIYT